MRFGWARDAASTPVRCCCRAGARVACYSDSGAANFSRRSTPSSAKASWARAPSRASWPPDTRCCAPRDTCERAANAVASLARPTQACRSTLRPWRIRQRRRPSKRRRLPQQRPQPQQLPQPQRPQLQQLPQPQQRPQQRPQPPQPRPPPPPNQTTLPAPPPTTTTKTPHPRLTARVRACSLRRVLNRIAQSKRAPKFDPYRFQVGGASVFLFLLRRRRQTN